MAIDGYGLRYYKGGIWDGTFTATSSGGSIFSKGETFLKQSCSQDKTGLNHSVLLVGLGYDEDSKTYYYIVKNSWGEKWGENGYFKLKYKRNICGLS